MLLGKIINTPLPNWNKIKGYLTKLKSLRNKQQEWLFRRLGRVPKKIFKEGYFVRIPNIKTKKWTIKFIIWEPRESEDWYVLV